MVHAGTEAGEACPGIGDAGRKSAKVLRAFCTSSFHGSYLFSSSPESDRRSYNSGLGASINLNPSLPTDRSGAHPHRNGKSVWPKHVPGVASAPPKTGVHDPAP